MAEDDKQDTPVASGSSKFWKTVGKSLVQSAAGPNRHTSRDPLMDLIFNRKNQIKSEGRTTRPTHTNGPDVSEELGATVGQLKFRRVDAPKVNTGDERIDYEVNRVLAQAAGAINDTQITISKALKTVAKSQSSLVRRVDKVQSNQKTLADQIGLIIRQMDDEKRTVKKAGESPLEKRLQELRERAASMERDNTGRFVKKEESSSLLNSAKKYAIAGGIGATLKTGAAVAGRAALGAAGGAAVYGGLKYKYESDRAEAKKETGRDMDDLEFGEYQLNKNRDEQKERDKLGYFENIKKNWLGMSDDKDDKSNEKKPEVKKAESDNLAITISSKTDVSVFADKTLKFKGQKITIEADEIEFISKKISGLTGGISQPQQESSVSRFRKGVPTPQQSPEISRGVGSNAPTSGQPSIDTSGSGQSSVTDSGSTSKVAVSGKLSPEVQAKTQKLISDAASGKVSLTSSAVDKALSQLGLNENRDRDAIKSYLRDGGSNLDPATTSWCAAFMNSTLAQSGIKGTGSNVATSFMGWGKSVDDPSGTSKGDILVQNRGRRQGETGGHVLMATGNKQVRADGTVLLETVSGNQGNKVNKSWISSNLVKIRRADESVLPQEVVEAQAKGIKLPDDSTRSAKKDNTDAITNGVSQGTSKMDALSKVDPTKLVGKDGYQKVYDIAKRLGDPRPEVTAAQWAQESGWGNRVSGTHNYFGQKAKKNEDSTSRMTNENFGGGNVRLAQNFKNYDSPEDAIKDHIKKWSPKYAGAKSTEEAVQLLQRHGYATDPNYVNAITSIANKTKVEDTDITTRVDAPSINPLSYNGLDPNDKRMAGPSGTMIGVQTGELSSYNPYDTQAKPAQELPAGWADPKLESKEDSNKAFETGTAPVTPAVPKSMQSRVNTSIRNPTHDPESQDPTPGSNGYGARCQDPDGGGICTV